MTESSEKLEIDSRDNIQVEFADACTLPKPSDEQESFLIEKSQEAPVSTSNLDEVKAEENNKKYNEKNVRYEGDIAIYTDLESGYEYQWDTDKNEWVPRSNVTYEYEDDTHVYTDKDGTKFFWDREKNAWFPKVDDDFMAHYQMNYGFNNQTDTESKTVDSKLLDAPPPTESKIKGEKRKASEPTWFEVDESQNTNVYVSNLPLDIEEQEFIDLMQKCGLVMRDPVTGKFKIKLYKETNTENLKGDALCTYIKIESVDLALSVLDGYNYKGRKIKVERAKFQLKGEYDPKLKPKMKKKKEKLKLKKQQEKLFDWRPEKKIGDRAKHERVVIIKNLFEPSLFDQDVGLILEFQQDLREEAGKIGEVRKVVIYDRHPEGVAQISMAQPEEADQVVVMLNGRWFMKRQLTAEIWDGKTKFKIAETDSQISQRLDGWDKYLEGDEKKSVIIVKKTLK
ncbi:HIV Tat-specific factor 1-like [Sitophilus oryzae]|uniref:17S U2 SnRNP complex component HTATSF1 n=1 Tax=Sitophilus oryzae TaxID=7048 RepID=A0A6J2XFI1_SITOR|nr:HIV Tat-specific factor 1-like [Sitophilus oryzae]